MLWGEAGIHRMKTPSAERLSSQQQCAFPNLPGASKNNDWMILAGLLKEG